MKVQGANGFTSNTVEGELFCQILCFFFPYNFVSSNLEISASF